ncbi:MAG: BrnT family toxin [Chloracidobacterium sp.]|nr:BrnT family toxin [Chloracidobacterium sp.]MCO5333118.1 BrnT family toxin [Pyrinomonadaceae bacterium]
MFAWDEAKRQEVIKNNGVDLALIADAFDDPFGVYFEDEAHSSDEEVRFNLIGVSAHYGLVYVTFNYDGAAIRLITAWKAEKWATKEYESNKR